MEELKKIAKEKQIPVVKSDRAGLIRHLKADGWVPDDRRPPELAESTARSYLHRLGFAVRQVGKGVFVDNHGREDVVKYREEVFIPQYLKYYEDGPNWFYDSVNDEWIDKDMIDDVTVFDDPKYLGLGGDIHPNTLERARLLHIV